VDSGDGAYTARVYDFTRARFARRVFAIKGAAGKRPPWQRSSVKGVPMFVVGVDGLKSQILSRLSMGATIRFSNRLEAEYFEQVTSEHAVVRYVRGQPVRQFVRVPGRRAEALDCLVYGLAARHALTTNLDRREEELASAAPPKRTPHVAKSSWMNR
jgi:phage terminase large subunit GpA-like protein